MSVTYTEVRGNRSNYLTFQGDFRLVKAVLTPWQKQGEARQ